LVSHTKGRTYTEGIREEYLNLRGRKWWEAGEDCIMRNFITCMYHQILSGGTRRMDDRDEKCIEYFGKPEGKRPLGRPRRRWEDHIRRDLSEIG
jgi:hypothetical protein